MKKNLIAGIPALALLLIALLFTACPDALAPPLSAGNDGLLGTLVLEIGGAERTLAPNPAGLTYKVLIRKGNTVYANETITGNSKTFSLAPDTYQVTAEAYSGTNLVATFSDTVAVDAGQTTR